MAFWTDAQNKDPKRAYRFIVNIGNMPNGAQWYAKAVKKPDLPDAVLSRPEPPAQFHVKRSLHPRS